MPAQTLSPQPHEMGGTGNRTRVQDAIPPRRRVSQGFSRSSRQRPDWTKQTPNPHSEVVIFPINTSALTHPPPARQSCLMRDATPERIGVFIARWEKSGGHERGSGQQFLPEFCELLGLGKKNRNNRRDKAPHASWLPSGRIRASSKRMAAISLKTVPRVAPLIFAAMDRHHSAISMLGRQEPLSARARANEKRRAGRPRSPVGPQSS